MIKKLKLFGQDWKIIYHKADEHLLTERRGLTHYPPREIHILQDTNERSTMLHELIHVAADTCGANMSEEQVVALERGLWMIFEANPKLMEYFVYGNTANATVLNQLLSYRSETAGTSGEQEPSHQ